MILAYNYVTVFVVGMVQEGFQITYAMAVSAER